MQTSYYPMEFVERGARRLLSSQDISEGTTQYLRESLGIKQVGYRDLITVRAPNVIEVEFFKLPSDGRVSVYELFRTAFDGNSQPMRLTVTRYRKASKGRPQIARRSERDPLGCGRPGCVGPVATAAAG
jgi:GntR family transcriptional regulator